MESETWKGHGVRTTKSHHIIKSIEWVYFQSSSHAVLNRTLPFPFFFPFNSVHCTSRIEEYGRTTEIIATQKKNEARQIIYFIHFVWFNDNEYKSSRLTFNILSDRAHTQKRIKCPWRICPMASSDKSNCLDCVGARIIKYANNIDSRSLCYYYRHPAGFFAVFFSALPMEFHTIQ